MKKLSALLFLSFLFMSHEAHAIRITNLDSVPRVLIVDNAGEIIEITLAPGASYHTYGPMVDLSVGRSGTVKRARWNADYAIWPGGKLYLQNRRENYRN